MKALDAEIDQAPSQAKVKQLAELRIRNHMAFRELQEYNDQGRFLYRHPLVVHYSLRNELKELLSSNPSGFLEEHANTRENVKRYRSFLKSKSRTEDQKKRDRENLKKHKEKEAVFEEILKETKA